MGSITSNSNLWLWLGVMALVGGYGLVTLLRAYLSDGGSNPQFSQPILAPTPPASTTEPESAENAFQKGNDAFATRHYRRAAAHYAQALQAAPNWAEAYHNRGLALANLDQTGEAAQELAKAAGLYLDGDNLVGLELVRQHLQQLKG
jgi:tetratricopeptide (TPR) repeat protein